MAFNKNKVVEVARKYVEKGQLDRAIKEYLRVVREDPKDVRVWLKLGDLYAKKGARLEAIETYLKVARFYSEQGFDLKAVAVYKQILKLDPRLIEVNLKLAELYRQMGLMKEAMEQFETVASHFHREGKTKEALATVRQLVDLDPENVPTRIKLAELYSKEGIVAEAISEFTKACDYLRANNRQDDFVKVAERLLWHQSDNYALTRELAELYLQRNDPRRALYKLRACFMANSRDIETLALLAQVFQALDQKSKTIQVLKELARVLEEDNDRERAKEVHRQILQLSPGDADSAAHLDSGPPAAPAPPPPPGDTSPTLSPVQRLAMAKDLPQPRKLNPTGSMPLVDPRAIPGLEFLDEDEVLVEDEFTSELTDDGEYDSSVEGEVYSEEIAKILTDADVYVRYGLHQKAIDHLRRIFELDPNNIEAHEQLKEILLNQGREREAVEELMRLAELTAHRDPDRAEAYLRELLGLDGTFQPAFDLASRCHLSVTGNHEIEIVDSYDGPTGTTKGAVAPIDEVFGFEDDEFGGADMAVESGDFAADTASTDHAGYEFAIDDGEAAYPAGGPDPSLVTMELKMDEVESLLELVDDDAEEAEGYDLVAPAAEVPAAAFPYDGAFPEPPLFDPEDAARFDAEPGYDPAGRGGVARPGPREPGASPGSEYDAPSFGASPYPATYVDPATSTATLQLSAEALEAGDIDEFAVELDSGVGHAFDAGPSGEHAALAHYGDGLLGATTDEVGLETVDTGLDVLEEKFLGGPAVLEKTSTGIEDELDEADFFISQRLYDEAREILDNLLARYSDHPLLLAKVAELDELRASAAAAARETYVPASQLASESLERFEPELLGDITGAGHGKQPTVLLENPVADEDAETHYDLGLAYKEMGLFDDAIKAFRKVLAVPGREVQCRLMIGLCQLEQNSIAEAIHQFKAGLHAPDINEREQLSLYYEIAVAYERINDPKEALYFYQLIYKRDPDYRDVAERIAAITQGIEQHAAESLQEAADDAEAAIDSLLAESDSQGRHSGSR